MVEIQALVVESFAPMPKRVFAGVDFNGGQLLTAIAQKSLGMPLYKYDVFVSVSCGGIKIDDTGADLAILAAMWSSYKINQFLGECLWGKYRFWGQEKQSLGEEEKRSRGNGKETSGN